jgi:hypothetical protein
MTKDLTIESKKLYLQKKLKKAENRLKKYIKEDNKTWAMMEQRRVWDLEEQLNNIK